MTFPRSAVRPRGDESQRAFTMTETLLTVVIAGIIMIPLLAWMLVVFDRADDTSQQERTADLAALSRTFVRDVESAAAATNIYAWDGLAICADPATIDPENPVATDPVIALNLETIETTDPLLETTQAVQTNYIVHERVVDDGSTRGTLWRRRCRQTETGPKTVDTLVGVNLLATSPTDPLETRYAQFTCRAADGGAAVTTTTAAPVVGAEECEVVTLTMQPEGADRFALSAMRRPDGEPVTEIRPRPVIVCSPSCEGTRNGDQEFVVSFDSSRSRNVDARLWSFGDGTPTSSDESPTHAFKCLQELCVFDVSLTVVGGEPRRGARATTQVIVRNFVPTVRLIEPAGGAIATFRQSSTVVKVEAIDHDASSNVLTYSIDWSDPGSTGNIQTGEYGPDAERTFTHVFERLIDEDQNKVVTLSITDEFGAGPTFRIPLVVKNAFPVAEFSANRSRVTLCPPGAVNCDDRVVSYDASFDPQSPNSRAHDPDGKKAPTDPSRRIGPSAVRDYEWSIVKHVAGGNPVIATLDTVCPAPGFPESANPCLSSGTSTSPIVSIKFPNVVAEWEVRMRATDEDDDASIGTKRLSSNQPPRAVIDYLPATRLVNENGSGGTPSAFSFTGARSFDPDGAEAPHIRAYKWTVRKSGETIPTASFTDANPEYSPTLPPGVYTVQLVVVDEHGAESPLVDQRIFGVAARTQVSVKVNARPSISMANHQRFDRGVPFTLSADVTDPQVGALSGVSDGDRIEEYRWRFREVVEGGGLADWTDWQETTGPTIDRQYSTLGSYRVELVAVDNHGAERSSGQLTFTVEPAAPVAAFEVSPGLIGKLGTSFEFHSTSYDPDNMGITRCLWTIDKVGGGTDTYDRTPCTDPPSRTYNQPGSYEVRLRVWDGEPSPYGPIVSRSDATKIIRVLHPLNVNVTLGFNGQYSNAPYANVREGGQVVFFPYGPRGGPTDDPNPGGGIESMHWDFGDGESSETNGAVSHNFRRKNGTNVFQVTLTVRSKLGLEVIQEFHITVNDHPVAMVFDSTTETEKLVYNVNCEPANPNANLTVAYAVTNDTKGCDIVAAMNDWKTAGDTLNADKSYDPDGGGPPDFHSSLLKDIELTNPETFCWRQGTTNLPTTGCMATRSRPATLPLSNSAPSPVLVQPDGTKNVVKMFLQVKDANGDKSTWVEFGVRLNAKPNNVRIVGGSDPAPLPNPAPPIILQTNLQTHAGLISSPAGDMDEDAELTYRWTFRPDGAPESGYVVYEAVGQKYPKVTFNSQISGWVDLTVTDEHGFAVDAPSRRFTVDESRPVAVIKVNGTATGSGGTPVWFVPPDGSHPRLVLTGTGGLKSITAGFTAADSYSPDGVAIPASGYSWRLTKQPDAPALSGPASDLVPTSGVTYGSKTYWGQTLFSSEVSATWTLELTVTDANGRFGTATLPIRLNRPPSSSYSCQSYYSNSVPYRVGLTNSSTDPDVATTGYDKPAYMRWDYGDGTGTNGWVDWRATVFNTYHAYNGNPSGRYALQFEVLDIDGASGGVVNCAPPLGVRVNHEPTYTLAASPEVVASTSTPQNRSVTFTSDIEDEDNPSLTGYTYSWRLVQGGTQTNFNTGVQVGGTQSTRNATFNVQSSPPAIYWGELTVTDAAGGGPAMRRRVKFRVNQPPTAKLVGEPGEVGTFAFQAHRERMIKGEGSIDHDTVDGSNPRGVITHYRFQFFDEDGNQLHDTGFVTSDNATVKLTKQVPSPTNPDQNERGRIRLTVRDEQGQTGTDEVDLYVFNQQPTALIKAITPNRVTHPAVPTFDGSESSDAGGGPISRYEWKLYRQSAPDTPIASHTSASPTWTPPVGAFGSTFWGDYSVSLVVYDSDNLPSTYDVTVEPPAYVEPPRRLFTMLASPTAVITSNPTETVFQGGMVQRVSFSGASSFDPDGDSGAPNYLTYRWSVKSDTGDEIITWNGRDFNNVDFIGSGTNYVHLTVTDADGNEHTAVKPVILNATPAVSLEPQPTWTNPAASPATTVSFNFVAAASDSDGSIDRSLWTFFKADGSIDSTVNVPGEPGNRSYAFPNVAGTYKVRLEVWDNSNGSTAQEVTVRVNAAPTAAIVGGPYAMSRGSSFVLDGSASDDLDSRSPGFPTGIGEYRWAFFAEGNPSTPYFEETTSSPLTSIIVPDRLVPLNAGGGVGRVRLVVVDANGLASPPVWTDLTVENSRPTAIATLEGGGAIGSPGMSRTFRGTASFDVDGDVEDYQWSFYLEGDSTPFDTATGEVVTTTFPTAGRYVVKLVVTDDEDATSLETVASVVQLKANLAPVAGIKDFASLTATVGVAQQFDGSAPDYSHDPDADDPDDQIMAWGWTVHRPDGTFFNYYEGATPTVTFDEPGNWRISLTVIDHDSTASPATPPFTVVVSP